ncbi:MAG: PP2C family protein-serine/threonine phosphatase [Saprospiraceae bacterium]|nr:PP2C family protein-serine/threonine phosphatase [Saprospiraceae bacterium]MDW8230986.1 PP2C family protein-serine/threonine phosphatase [Saprospiraceae bacterium]
MSNIEQLERELSLKKLQLNNLLTLTQAINENVPAAELYRMYCDFLHWHIGIAKVALFFKENGRWQCVQSVGIPEEDVRRYDMSEELPRFVTNTRVNGDTHPFVQQFDLVLPVMHKREPIAYAFWSEVPGEDAYSKLQIAITITNVLAVAIENKRLFKNQLQQELFNREVQYAAEIQQALVPVRLPSSQHYQLSSIYKPHFAVGGDYYDVFELKDGSLLFCIADVTGKGIPAALLMSNIQATLNALVTRCQSLEEIVTEMNNAIFRVTGGDRFITLFICRYEPRHRSLHYINAGHTPPLLLCEDEVIPLTNGCTILGGLPKLPFLEIGGLCLLRNATLFAYTDGLTDVRNNQGEFFSEERLIPFLKENCHLDARALNTKLLAHVEDFRQQQPLPDDITVLTCKIFL